MDAVEEWNGKTENEEELTEADILAESYITTRARCSADLHYKHLSVLCSCKLLLEPVMSLLRNAKLCKFIFWAKQSDMSLYLLILEFDALKKTIWYSI